MWSLHSGLTLCVLFFTVNIKILRRNTKRRRKPNTKMEVQKNTKTNIKTETRKNGRRKRYRTSSGADFAFVHLLERV